MDFGELYQEMMGEKTCTKPDPQASPVKILTSCNFFACSGTISDTL